MSHHPSITETGFARLRAIMARAAARALGLDRMKALLIAQLQLAIAQIEALFAAWQNGTLPAAPAPASFPQEQPAPSTAQAATAPPPQSASGFFRWPLFSSASLGAAVLDWLLPLPPPLARTPGAGLSHPRRPRPSSPGTPRAACAPSPPITQPGQPPARTPLIRRCAKPRHATVMHRLPALRRRTPPATGAHYPPPAAKIAPIRTSPMHALFVPIS